MSNSVMRSNEVNSTVSVRLSWFIMSLNNLSKTFKLQKLMTADLFCKNTYTIKIGRSDPQVEGRRWNDWWWMISSSLHLCFQRFLTIWTSNNRFLLYLAPNRRDLEDAVTKLSCRLSDLDLQLKHLRNQAQSNPWVVAASCRLVATSYLTLGSCTKLQRVFTQETISLANRLWQFYFEMRT